MTRQFQIFIRIERTYYITIKSTLIRHERYVILFQNLKNLETPSYNELTRNLKKKRNLSSNTWFSLVYVQDKMTHSVYTESEKCINF
jgi:hypothetical protein